MVSEEFKRNVESKDVVTVRSALVDYLIIIGIPFGLQFFKIA